MHILWETKVDDSLNTTRAFNIYHVIDNNRNELHIENCNLYMLLGSNGVCVLFYWVMG